MLVQGDAALIPLSDKSVHTCVTSPPYWGLRRYSGEQGRGMFPDLGLEKTPQEFIERMVAVFAEVYRVLRDDGCVWLNFGDCYATNHSAKAFDKDKGWKHGKKQRGEEGRAPACDIPAGNLMLMPHRIAIALQDWGWIVRNDVVWWKRNPMPESQAGWRFERERKKIGRRPDPTPGTYGAEFNHGLSRQAGYREEGGLTAEYEYGEDYHLRKGSWRHTRAHEYVFMLTKKMQYWSNQEAVRENHQSTRWGGEIITQPPDTKYAEATAQGFAGAAENLSRPGREWNAYPSGGRNPRSVMDVPTAPYKGAHYATFPPNLIAPLIRATCPRWACPVCGQGWSPVVEKEYKQHPRNPNPIGRDPESQNPEISFRPKENKLLIANVKNYRPTCEHEHTKDEAVPGICLDPFVGSGTTVMVAKQLLRRGIGLDISMEYIDQQAKVRTGEGSPSGVLDDLPLFNLELLSE